ncbi:MAG TPA: hypothetical protein V6C81_11175 [Planktothrix sp.]|jgi:hypothetical protein
MSTETPEKTAPRPTFTMGEGVNCTPIRSIKGRVRLQGKGSVFSVQQGQATIASGCTAFAWPGTDIKANSGSVILAFAGAKVTAHKRAVLIWIE